ncbi:hypothetical protein [Pseudoxanthomonas suwonensis]|uniref:hypothetical protein n=1 Tax=Pseudoxanthomonas suwonensis TaxID=314722 RepID=UPI00046727FD
MRRLLELSLLGMACCSLQAMAAQEPAQPPPERIRVSPVENVKVDYAHVLRVEPVYQTLRATRTEEQCDPVPAPVERPAQREEPGVFSRMVDSVKDFFSGEQRPTPAPAPAHVPATRQNCRLVQVDRQFQRPIAYDVDYVYKGTKYRSRLAEDPGNRLRVRVSVTPWEEEPALPAAPTP